MSVYELAAQEYPTAVPDDPEVGRQSSVYEQFGGQALHDAVTVEPLDLAKAQDAATLGDIGSDAEDVLDKDADDPDAVGAPLRLAQDAAPPIPAADAAEVQAPFPEKGTAELPGEDRPAAAGSGVAGSDSGGRHPNEGTTAVADGDGGGDPHDDGEQVSPERPDPDLEHVRSKGFETVEGYLSGQGYTRDDRGSLVAPPTSGAETEPFPAQASPEGPSDSETAGYYELRDRASRHEDGLRFRPRVVAELTSTKIDEGKLGTFISRKEGGELDDSSRLKVNLQRYVATSIGLQVGETVVYPHEGTALTNVTIPRVDDVSPPPYMDRDGGYHRADGTDISRVTADTLHASRFLAEHRDHFSRPEAFETLFREVVRQAEACRALIVEDKVGDPQGAMSLVRQVATVMGYTVEDYRRGDDGTYTAAVIGTRPEMDDQFTYFKGAPARPAGNA